MQKDEKQADKDIVGRREKRQKEKGRDIQRKIQTFAYEDKVKDRRAEGKRHTQKDKEVERLRDRRTERQTDSQNLLT